MRTKNIARAVILSGLFITGVAPFLLFFAASFFEKGKFTVHAYTSLLSSHNFWILLGRSVSLSLMTSLLTVVLGLPLGILLGKSDLPLRRFFLWVITVPLLLPPYILAVSWFQILGPHPIQGFFGWPGCIWVDVTLFLPVVIWLTISSIHMINPNLEEAARLVARWPGILKGITVPLIRPVVMLAAVIVFLLSFGELSVPLFLRYDVFPVEVLTQFSATYHFGRAMAASFPIIVFTIALLFLENTILRRKGFQFQSITKTPQLLIQLGKLKWIYVLPVMVYGAVCVILPFLALVKHSVSMSAYAQAVSAAGPSLLRSLEYSIIGASLLMVLGFVLGYFFRPNSGVWGSGVSFITLCFFVLPGSILGISLIHFWNHSWLNVIYGTPLILILGSVIQYLFLTYRVSVITLGQIPPSMEEAARTVGVKWHRRVLSILVPLSMPGLVAGWIIAYIFCFRDTGISMVLYPPGSDTYSTRIFTLMANGSQELIAALCVIAVTMSLIPLILIGPLIRKLRGSVYGRY